MLFDLQGKRRRVVQATYLMLAVLMGGGLLFFGIGGDVQGGLFDAFSDRGGSSGTNVVDDRIEQNLERVKADPKNAQAHKELTQDYYSKAASLPVGEDGKVPPSGQDELKKADASYRAFLEAKTGKADTSLALTALQLYGPGALNQPKELQEAARLRAEVENDSESYLLLVDAASRAGNTRAADLAGLKVVDLAPKDQKKQARKAVKETKAAALAAQTQGAGAAQGAAPSPTPAPQP